MIERLEAPSGSRRKRADYVAGWVHRQIDRRVEADDIVEELYNARWSTSKTEARAFVEVAVQRFDEEAKARSRRKWDRDRKIRKHFYYGLIFCGFVLFLVMLAALAPHKGGDNGGPNVRALLVVGAIFLAGVANLLISLYHAARRRLEREPDAPRAIRATRCSTLT